MSPHLNILDSLEDYCKFPEIQRDCLDLIDSKKELTYRFRGNFVNQPGIASIVQSCHTDHRWYSDRKFHGLNLFHIKDVESLMSKFEDLKIFKKSKQASIISGLYYVSKYATDNGLIPEEHIALIAASYKTSKYTKDDPNHLIPHSIEIRYSRELQSHFGGVTGKSINVRTLSLFDIPLLISNNPSALAPLQRASELPSILSHDVRITPFSVGAGVPVVCQGSINIVEGYKDASIRAIGYRMKEGYFSKNGKKSYSGNYLDGHMDNSSPVYLITLGTGNHTSIINFLSKNITAHPDTPVNCCYDSKSTNSRLASDIRLNSTTSLSNNLRTPFLSDFDIEDNLLAEYYFVMKSKKSKSLDVSRLLESSMPQYKYSHDQDNYSFILDSIVRSKSWKGTPTMEIGSDKLQILNNLFSGRKKSKILKDIENNASAWSAFEFLDSRIDVVKKSEEIYSEDIKKKMADNLRKSVKIYKTSKDKSGAKYIFNALLLSRLRLVYSIHILNKNEADPEEVVSGGISNLLGFIKEHGEEHFVENCLLSGYTNIHTKASKFLRLWCDIMKSRERLTESIEVLKEFTYKSGAMKHAEEASWSKAIRSSSDIMQILSIRKSFISPYTVSRVESCIKEIKKISKDINSKSIDKDSSFDKIAHSLSTILDSTTRDVPDCVGSDPVKLDRFYRSMSIDTGDIRKDYNFLSDADSQKVIKELEALSQSLYYALLSLNTIYEREFGEILFNDPQTHYRLILENRSGVSPSDILAKVMRRETLRVADILPVAGLPGVRMLISSNMIKETYAFRTQEGRASLVKDIKEVLTVDSKRLNDSSQRFVQDTSPYSTFIGDIQTLSRSFSILIGLKSSEDKHNGNIITKAFHAIQKEKKDILKIAVQAPTSYGKTQTTVRQFIINSMKSLYRLGSVNPTIILTDWINYELDTQIGEYIDSLKSSKSTTDFSPKVSACEFCNTLSELMLVHRLPKACLFDAQAASDFIDDSHAFRKNNIANLINTVRSFRDTLEEIEGEGSNKSKTFLNKTLIPLIREVSKITSSYDNQSQVIWSESDPYQLSPPELRQAFDFNFMGSNSVYENSPSIVNVCIDSLEYSSPFSNHAKEVYTQVKELAIGFVAKSLMELTDFSTFLDVFQMERGISNIFSSKMSETSRGINTRDSEIKDTLIAIGTHARIAQPSLMPEYRGEPRHLIIIDEEPGSTIDFTLSPTSIKDLLSLTQYRTVSMYTKEIDGEVFLDSERINSHFDKGIDYIKDKVLTHRNIFSTGKILSEVSTLSFLSNYSGDHFQDMSILETYSGYARALYSIDREETSRSNMGEKSRLLAGMFLSGELLEGQGERAIKVLFPSLFEDGSVLDEHMEEYSRRLAEYDEGDSLSRSMIHRSTYFLPLVMTHICDSFVCTLWSSLHRVKESDSATSVRSIEDLMVDFVSRISVGYFKDTNGVMDRFWSRFHSFMAMDSKFSAVEDFVSHVIGSEASTTDALYLADVSDSKAFSISRGLNSTWLNRMIMSTVCDLGSVNPEGEGEDILGLVGHLKSRKSIREGKSIWKDKSVLYRRFPTTIDIPCQRSHIVYLDATSQFTLSTNGYPKMTKESYVDIIKLRDKILDIDVRIEIDNKKFKKIVSAAKSISRDSVQRMTKDASTTLRRIFDVRCYGGDFSQRSKESFLINAGNLCNTYIESYEKLSKVYGESPKMPYRVSNEELSEKVAGYIEKFDTADGLDRLLEFSHNPTRIIHSYDYIQIGTDRNLLDLETEIHQCDISSMNSYASGEAHGVDESGKDYSIEVRGLQSTEVYIDSLDLDYVEYEELPPDNTVPDALEDIYQGLAVSISRSSTVSMELSDRFDWGGTLGSFYNNMQDKKSQVYSHIEEMEDSEYVD